MTEEGAGEGRAALIALRNLHKWLYITGKIDDDELRGLLKGNVLAAEAGGDKAASEALVQFARSVWKNAPPEEG